MAHSFLLLNNMLFSECPSLFLPSPTEEHLGCFHVLVIMNKATINICVQVLCEHRFSHSCPKTFLGTDEITSLSLSSPPQHLWLSGFVLCVN